MPSPPTLSVSCGFSRSPRRPGLSLLSSRGAGPAHAHGLQQREKRPYGQGAKSGKCAWRWSPRRTFHAVSPTGTCDACVLRLVVRSHPPAWGPPVGGDPGLSLPEHRRLLETAPRGSVCQRPHPQLHPLPALGQICPENNEHNEKRSRGFSRVSTQPTSKGTRPVCNALGGYLTSKGKYN